MPRAYAPRLQTAWRVNNIATRIGATNVRLIGPSRSVGYVRVVFNDKDGNRIIEKLGKFINR